MTAPSSAFAAALLDASHPVPIGVLGRGNGPVDRRFAVYRNNVIVSLVDAVAAGFPVCRRLVGDDFFRAMARAYVVEQPPQSPVLISYGDGFAEFVAGFAPARALPYLADVARVEAAYTRSYHAADAPPLGTAEFAGVDPVTLGGLRLRFHPSVEIVRSRWAVATIWHANAAIGDPPPIDPSIAEDVLIRRPHLVVTVQPLLAGVADWLLAISARQTLAEATAQAVTVAPHFDLAAALALIISGGLAVAFDDRMGR